jgi:hypothetical protein
MKPTTKTKGMDLPTSIAPLDYFAVSGATVLAMLRFAPSRRSKAMFHAAPEMILMPLPAVAYPPARLK